MTTESTPGHRFLSCVIAPRCRLDSKAGPFGLGGLIPRLVHLFFPAVTGFLPFNDQRRERVNGIAVLLNSHWHGFNTLHSP